MSRRKVSARSERFWKKLASWYGARLGDQFGVEPPSDWCLVIDDASNDTILRALSEIRRKHPDHPPTFPQFAAIVSTLTRARANGPTNAERLADYVIKHRKLTPTQLRGGWTYVGVEGQPVAVDVPPDGETPGFRVRLADLDSSYL